MTSAGWTTPLGRHFSVSTDKRRLIGGGCFTVLLFAFVLLHTQEFLQEYVPCGTLLFCLTLLSCGILGALTVLCWRCDEKASRIISVVVFCLLPIVAMTMVECLNGVFTWDWSFQTLLLNYILYFLFYGFVYVLSGSLRLPMLIVNPLFFVLALANFYVKAFRGTPLVPIDIVSAKTAANVAAAYDFSFNYQVVIAVVLLAFLEIAAYKLRTPAADTVIKIALRAFFGTLIVCVVGLYVFTDAYADAGLKPDYWNQSRGYRNTGVVLNFCLNTKYLFVSRPAGYDPDEVEQIVSAGDDGEPTGTQTPNIICIMNESLADLGVLGDVKTNIDYMPFLHSLTENTVRGNLYVPVIGSGTSNTEFEFLTGASTSFFPAGSNAFMLYVKNPIPSLTRTLGRQGYGGIAFHPYYSSGWNRVNVYNYMGFSRFSSITSVIDRSVLMGYQNSGFDEKVLEQLAEEAYPGQSVLLRRYVSDSYNYRKVIEMYEKRDLDEPFFMFNVTMQNHGGYTEQADNFTQEVYALGENGNPLNVPKTNQYLSLIKRSDDAFRELIDYFSVQEEPTVICLFGDHQPNIEESYIADLLGVNSLYTLSDEQEQKRYITPFYIWANYPIEEQYIERLSVNFLSSYLMKTAGVQTTPFSRYLLRLSETVPVIDNIGIIDKDGNHYKDAGNSPYSTLLKQYEKVIYQMIFDSENRKDTLFTPE